LRFWWRDASWSSFIFHTLASILESFVPSLDLCRREGSLSISFPRHFEGFRCAVTHFHRKFYRIPLFQTRLHFSHDEALEQGDTTITLTTMWRPEWDWNGF
jgi:hypothetical protein